jgi:hypothetical protein
VGPCPHVGVKDYGHGGGQVLVYTQMKPRRVGGEWAGLTASPHPGVQGSGDGGGQVLVYTQVKPRRVGGTYC